MHTVCTYSCDYFYFCFSFSYFFSLFSQLSAKKVLSFSQLCTMHVGLLSYYNGWEQSKYALTHTHAAMRDPNACERSHRKTFAFDSRFQFQFHSIDKSCWTAPKHAHAQWRRKKMKNHGQDRDTCTTAFIYLHWMQAIIRHQMINTVPDSHDVIAGQSIWLWCTTNISCTDAA